MVPLVLSNFIKLFIDPNQENVEANMYVNGILLTIIPFFITIMLHHGNHQFGMMGIKGRVAITSLVYRKVGISWIIIIPVVFLIIIDVIVVMVIVVFE